MGTGCLVVSFTIVVLIFAQEANCLSCYSCSSQVSWADCNAKMNKMACPSGSPNCVKGELACTADNAKTTVFYKGCGTEGKECQITKNYSPSCPTSPFQWSFSSSSECCDGNNCNSGLSQKISFVVFGACMSLLLCIFTHMY